jgi:hypothetical protein
VKYQRQFGCFFFQHTFEKPPKFMQ